MKNKNMSFSFSFVTKETILNELRKLNPKKACQEIDIPIKIIKENLDIVSNFVYNNFNNSLFSSNFPSYLKNANITLIFKKKDLRIIVQYYNSLQMLQSYLSSRKQRTKINDAYNKYCEILFEVSQGSILGPLLFNVYICDMFYDIIDCDIASYADDNTPYASSNNLDAVINKLEESTNNLFQLFRNNHMKANADKCHLLVTGNCEVSSNINEFEIESSKKEKLLVISIDTRLSFEDDITSLCKKNSQKLHALARIAHYVDVEKRRSLMKAFVIS